MAPEYYTLAWKTIMFLLYAFCLMTNEYGMYADHSVLWL
jgi:hypothetical protein